jgi:hypothetical protein
VILLTQALSFIGWRGGLGLLAGAVLVMLPAYEAGVWTEAAACRERTGRAIAEHDIQRMERENGKIAAAAAARARAGAVGADGDGRMPDDGFRRD